MLCWVYIVDGAQAGRCAASAATTWAPSSEESLKWSESDGLPSLEISLESVESYADPHSILPNHTEGHRLNGRDVLSRKAGLRLGKDSTGVEASPNQDKLRRMNKYCRLQGLNRCPLAWELGTLPLDHLGFDLTGNYTCIHLKHGLRTPNEGINQRHLKFSADVADEIFFGHT